MSRRRLAFTIVLVSLATAAAAAVSLAAHSVAKRPIVIGMINQQNSPAGSFPENYQGASAAVQYLNDKYGGFDGHQLKLVLCTTVGTPESSTTCANKLVALKPLVITSGVDF